MLANPLLNTSFSDGLSRKLNRLWSMVGNTPMIEILYEYKGRQGIVYAKCEHYNLTGSIKDRMALYILQKAYEENSIQPGDRILEATSGNTGIAMAAIGRALGHKVTIIMPDWMSKERQDIIKSLGAEVLLISKEEGGFVGSIELTERIASDHPGVFLPRQFENNYNAEAHAKTTGPEIWMQLAGVGQLPDAFVAGVGTGGTVMGMNAYLKNKDPRIKVHPLEPLESPTLTTGYRIGSHRIQGISDEFIPAILQLDELDPVVQVSDGDAILMAQKMAQQLGLAVGISSGANILGAIRVHHQMKGDPVVVTVLSDSNKKYLSTDLMKKEIIKPGYLTPQIELIDYTPINRAFEVR
jgi:cysteine synthase A